MPSDSTPLVRLCALMVFALAMAGNVVIQRSLDARASVEPLSPPSVPSLPAALVQGLLRRRVAADIVWMRAMSYAGDSRFAALEHPNLDGLIHLVVELDPDFRAAYLLGGLALSGPIESTRAGTELLERAARRWPQDWVFPFLAGSNYFLTLGDPLSAAEQWRQAATLPGAPTFTAPLAVRALATAGDCMRTLALAKEMTQASSGAVADALRRRARHLAWECAMRKIEGAATTYRERTGSRAKNLDELVAAGDLDAVPPDAFGGRFGLAPDGSVVSTTSMPRLKLVGPKVPPGGKP